MCVYLKIRFLGCVCACFTSSGCIFLLLGSLLFLAALRQRYIHTQIYTTETSKLDMQCNLSKVNNFHSRAIQPTPRTLELWDNKWFCIVCIYIVCVCVCLCMRTVAVDSDGNINIIFGLMMFTCQNKPQTLDNLIAFHRNNTCNKLNGMKDGRNGKYCVCTLYIHTDTQMKRLLFAVNINTCHVNDGNFRMAILVHFSLLASPLVCFYFPLTPSRQ